MRDYVIAQGIAAVVQSLALSLVMVVTERKLTKEWEEASER